MDAELGRPAAVPDDGLRLVVGSDSGIGSRLFARLAAAGVFVRGTTRRPGSAGGPVGLLDLSEPPSAWELPDRVSVAYLCAAVTSIEECTREPVRTRAVNVDRTVTLARHLRERGALVVFLSTNQVFDGTRPRRPADDLVCPRTEYGRQKADTEREVLALGGAVVRLTKVFTAPPPLLRNWAAALQAGDPVAPFSDMVLSPVPSELVTGVLAAVGDRRAVGVVQVSGDRDVSYAELAARLADRVGADRGLVRPVTAATRGLAPGAAPPHTTLDTIRLVREFGAAVPQVEATVGGLIDRAAADAQPEPARRAA
jgi:dTDP-4-dehydrorhamnose reductase